MYRSMVDIHSATAEIVRGKTKKERKKQDKNIMSSSATQGGCYAGKEKLDLGRRVRIVMILRFGCGRKQKPKVTRTTREKSGLILGDQ